MHKIIDKFKYGRKNSLRIIVLFCCLVFLMVNTVACFSLNINQNTSNGASTVEDRPDYQLDLDEKGQITDVSLILAMIEAVNGTANVLEVYEAIPNNRKTELTLNDFSLFIDALKHPESIEILEFRRISADSKKQITVDVTTNFPNLAMEAENSEYYEILYTEQGDGSAAISTIIGIQHNSDEEAYLSGSWIKEINQIYEFSRLYFEAVANRDHGMLAWLLQQSYSGSIDDQIVEIEENKAKLLIDYYRLSVATEPQNSIVHLLLPNVIEYYQELNAITSNQSRTRTCSFRQSNNLITVSDPYPERIKNQHLNLYYKDQFLFSWANNGVREVYYSDNFNNLLGKPQIEKIEMPDPLDEGADFWRITYRQLTLLVRGDADIETDFWSGKVEQLELHDKSTNLSLGNVKGEADSLYYDMPLNSFYRNYPFSPEANYTIEGQQQSLKMELVVQINKDTVTRLIIRAIYD